MKCLFRISNCSITIEIFLINFKFVQFPVNYFLFFNWRKIPIISSLTMSLSSNSSIILIASVVTLIKSGLLIALRRQLLQLPQEEDAASADHA